MKSLLLIIALIFISEKQAEFTLAPAESKMVIQGTSSIHDWESNVNDFSINGVINESVINDLLVKVATKSIESGKGIMDKKTYEALEADDHPSITFAASALTVKDNKIIGEGKLTVAGSTKAIPVDATLKSMTEQEMKIEGRVAFKMSEFGIDPPTAMFGSLKTGDEVTIIYDIVLKK